MASVSEANSGNMATHQPEENREQRSNEDHPSGTPVNTSTSEEQTTSSVSREALSSSSSGSDLEIASKEYRTFEKRAPTYSQRFGGRDRVVMCRYNPTHMFDILEIDKHQEICKDRLRLEKYGC
ncbi:hypothetical protein OSTOST_00115 [Ostertagia ostertagi]